MDSINSLYGNYFFLNPNYPSVVVDELEIEYPSVTHAFEAHRSKSYLERVEIAQLPLIKDRISYKTFVTSCNRIVRSANPEWDDDNYKIRIMKQLTKSKFENNDDLNRKLRDTNKTEIRVLNYNMFWGLMYDIADMKYTGENHLGKILMDVRQDQVESKLFDADFDLNLNFSL